MHSARSARIAVLASGNGSNFEALAVAAERGALGGTIVGLLSDRADAFALERARRLGIPAFSLSPGAYRTRLEDEQPWLETLADLGADLILLAGFMRRLHAPFLDAFPGRILNIHPSLLPAFPGLDAVGQAFRAGLRETGCTVHMVDAAIDAGPIVAQAMVEVLADDTLERLKKRMHVAEWALYPAAVRRFLEEPWHIAAGRLVFGAEEGAHG